MEGTYTKTVKQAFQLTKGYKFFWLAGLFLVWPLLFRSILILSFLGIYLEQSGLITESTVPEGQQPGNPWVGLAVLAVVGVLVIYYFRNKAAVIGAVRDLRTKSEINAKSVYEVTAPHIANLIKLGFGLGAFMLFFLAVLTAPVAYLITMNSLGRAGILGILALLIYLPIFAVVCWLSIFAPLFLVLYDMPIGDSIRASFDVIRKNWVNLLLFALVMFGVEIIALILSMTLMAAAILPFVLLSRIFYDMGGQALQNTLFALAGIAGFMVFFMSQGVIAAFQKIAWTIAFFEIIKPIKPEEEEETVPVPEAAT